MRARGCQGILRVRPGGYRRRARKSSIEGTLIGLEGTHMGVEGASGVERMRRVSEGEVTVGDNYW